MMIPLKWRITCFQPFSKVAHCGSKLQVTTSTKPWYRRLQEKEDVGIKAGNPIPCPNCEGFVFFAFARICWVCPPSQDASDHQDYFMFSRGFLKTFICHYYWEGGQPNVYVRVNRKIYVENKTFFPTINGTFIVVIYQGGKKQQMPKQKQHGI